MASDDGFTTTEEVLAEAAAEAGSKPTPDPVKPDPAPKGEAEAGDKLKAALLISTAVAAVLGAIFAIAKKINAKEAAA